MNDNPKLPFSLKVVAVLFILAGASAVMEILLSLGHGRLSINFGVLGLFIGPGLFALRPGWRTCALVFLWIAMIGVPIVAMLMLAQPGSANLNLLGLKVGHVSKELALAFAVGAFLLAVWQYWVLTRSDVRSLFGIESDL